MKTPMQELIEHTRKLVSEHGHELTAYQVLNSVMSKAESMLKKEKEVIVRAYMHVSNDMEQHLEDVHLREFAEDYYAKTFDIKEK